MQGAEAIELQGNDMSYTAHITPHNVRCSNISFKCLLPFRMDGIRPFILVSLSRREMADSSDLYFHATCIIFCSMETEKQKQSRLHIDFQPRSV